MEIREWRGDEGIDRYLYWQEIPYNTIKYNTVSDDVRVNGRWNRRGNSEMKWEEIIWNERVKSWAIHDWIG